MSNKAMSVSIDGMRIIMPGGAMGAWDGDTPLDSAMRLIALAIDPDDKEWSSKYGINFENDVFMMHRYCWCEEESCQWCDGDAPNFLHKKSGFCLNWYKYIGRGMTVNKKISGRELKEIVQDCLVSVSQKETKKNRRAKGAK